MSSNGPVAAYEAVEHALAQKPVPDVTGLPADELADGAMWMLDQALSVTRSANRPRELLDATAALLVPEPGPNPVEGPAWALWLITNEVTGNPVYVDTALAEGLTARPGQSWDALARTLATLAALHDGDGAGAWLRARRPDVDSKGDRPAP